MASIIEKKDVMDGLNNMTESVNDFKTSTMSKIDNLKSQTMDIVSPLVDNTKDAVKYIRDTDKQITETISNYKSNVLGFLDSFIDSISFGYLNLNNFNDIVTIGKNGVSFDTDRLIKKISASVGFDVSSMSSICDGLVNNTISALGDAFEYDLGRLFTMDGGEFKYTGDFRSTEGAGIMDLLVRGDGTLLDMVDVLAQTFFYDQVVKEAVIYGYSTSYEGLYNNYALEDDAKNAFLNALTYAIQNGDLDSVEKILDLLDESAGSVEYKYPNLVKDMLANYKFANDVYSEKYEEVRNRIIDIFVRVRGDNWDKRYNKPLDEWIIDLELGEDISQDALTLFKDYDKLQEVICLKGLIDKQQPLDLLSTQIGTLIIL